MRWPPQMCSKPPSAGNENSQYDCALRDWQMKPVWQKLEVPKFQCNFASTMDCGCSLCAFENYKVVANEPRISMMTLSGLHCASSWDEHQDIMAQAFYQNQMTLIQNLFELQVSFLRGIHRRKWYIRREIHHTTKRSHFARVCRIKNSIQDRQGKQDWHERQR